MSDRVRVYLMRDQRQSLMEYLITHDIFDHLYVHSRGRVLKEIFESPKVEIEALPDLATDFDLPPELVSSILLEAFKQLIETFNFKEAWDICRSNKLALKSVYNFLYGTKGDTSQMILAVSHLMRLGEHLLVVLDIEQDPQESRIAIQLYNEICFMGDVTSFLRPWDFEYGADDPKSLHGTYYLTNARQFVPFDSWYTGPHIGNIVWTTGGHVDGMYHCRTMFHPVFTFILSDVTNVLIPTVNNLWANEYFRKMSDFLKYVFGPRTGVFFMAKRETDADNIFIATSRLLLTY